MAVLDLHAILASLTLVEKISLLAGKNFWETQDIPNKGIPSLKVSDGPNGARGSTFKELTSACFPAASSVASTFDIDIARRIGVALAEETHTKGARCLLGPTVCGHRHPLGGRNFESFSEDPFLSGKMAAQNIIGLESAGVAATVKHFVANEQETQRLTVNAVVSQRALREIYLKPFEMAIKQGKPGAVMTAYNKVNGCHMDSHPMIEKVLRGEWGWDGLVMSDWGGVNSTAEALNAGLDLEMPGPAYWRAPDSIKAAIAEGTLTEATLNQRVLRVLRFLERQSCFRDLHVQATNQEKSIDNVEHRRLIREAGAKGIVLLKNEHTILPLTAAKVAGKKIALLGLAKEALISGGGSAAVTAHYRVTPFDALQPIFIQNGAKVTYARGAHTARQFPLMSSLTENITGKDGKSGFTCTVRPFDESQATTIVHGRELSNISFMDGIENVSLRDAHIEMFGIFTPPESAVYYFSLSGLGPASLLIDGKVIYEQKENCPDSMGYLFSSIVLEQISVPLQAGRPYRLVVKSSPPLPSEEPDEGLSVLKGQVAVRLGCASSIGWDRNLLTEAVSLAKEADIVIIFTGNEATWETEAVDQASFHLPRDGSQDQLVASAAAVNPKTIVVNSTGVPVAMPWLNQVQGLLHTWFPGQEAGNSIADVLTGARNAEGSLTCTFPGYLENCPAFGNFPGKYINGKLSVDYEEGVFVGYRHFDRLPIHHVNFPFGFGLSYTTFAYSDLSITPQSSGKSSFSVGVRVSNTGPVSGATSVQVYVGRVEQLPEDPTKILVGFAKVSLDAGETKLVDVTVEARDFAVWDEDNHQWLVRGGPYMFSIGRDAAQLVASSVIVVPRQSFHP